jgi:predicted nucleic acid-binding Zn ribbon protein
MHCTFCSTNNDSDAAFCSECGRPLHTGPRGPLAKSRKAYLFALVLIPVLAAVAWLGYYKFILPEGIAAVVNGEEIKITELDTAAPRSQGMEAAEYRNFRYQALNALIVEKLVFQEARAAGIRVSGKEISSAVAEAQASSGLDHAAFKRQITEQYGNEEDFGKVLERRLLIMKFFSEQIVPRGADPQTAHTAVNRWIQKASEKALVRIDLAEEVSGSGCACCNGGGTSEQGLLVPETKVARDAGLAYWHEKHGPDAVTAQLKDYGCHIRIDIMKNDKIVSSLRYQAGKISEM